jgi:uncharacterized protein
MATTQQDVQVERARRAYEAFGKGDLAAVGEFLADDAVYHISGNSPLSGDYKGKDAIFVFGKIMQETDGTFRLEVHDILANDDHGVVLVRPTAQRNGKSWDSRAVQQLIDLVPGRYVMYMTKQRRCAPAPSPSSPSLCC